MLDDRDAPLASSDLLARAFVGFYVVVEFGQDHYDEVTPHVGLKVAGGSLLLAILLTALKYFGVPASLPDHLHHEHHLDLAAAIVCTGRFILVFRSHPWHGLGLGLATMILVSGLATMGVDSILSKPVPTTQSSRLLMSNPSASPAVGRAEHRSVPRSPK